MTFLKLLMHTKSLIDGLHVAVWIENFYIPPNHQLFINTKICGNLSIYQLFR